LKPSTDRPPSTTTTVSESPTLTGSHLRTYNTIFQHPISHNLEWRNVRSLLEHVAEVVEQPNGNLRVARNGQSMVLHAPKTKDFAEMEEVMELRRFLERSGTASADPGAKQDHWLVVINHHEARIYRSEIHGTLPERILPHEPDDFFRHAHHSKEFSRGREKPDPNSFFEPVAAALKGAGRILVFGTGTGTSSEMEQFLAWLKKHSPEVAGRVIGSQVIDEHHLTEGQLLSKAREFYTATPVT
jgi:hypothetical protein